MGASRLARTLIPVPPNPDPRPKKSHPITRNMKVGLAAIVVALVLLGQLIFLVGAIRNGGLLSPSGAAVEVPRTGTLTQRLNAILGQVLGPSDRGVARFRLLRVAPDPNRPSLHAIDVRWALNNDLSAGTLGNGAQVDVYAIARAVFASHLHVGLLTLEGTYPLSAAGSKMHETVVMRLSVDQSVAATVARAGWGSLGPTSLWPLLRRTYINPDFQPVSTE